MTPHITIQLLTRKSGNPGGSDSKFSVGSKIKKLFNFWASEIPQIRKSTPQTGGIRKPPKSGNQLHIVTKEFSPGLEVKMTQILEKMSKNVKNRKNRHFRKKHPNLPRIWDPQNPKNPKITILDILEPH